MLRTGPLCQTLPILLLLWAGSGGAQTFTQALPSAPTVAVAASSDPISGLLTNTISGSTLAESLSPSLTQIISVSNSTSSLTASSTTSSIPSGLDDPATHLHSLAPIIAGSLAVFMVLLASVLVAIVASKRKRRRRRSHALSNRFTANAHDRSIPSRRSSGRHNFMRQPIDSPTASIDLPSRPSKKLRTPTRFDDDVDVGRQHEAPRIVVTDDDHHSHAHHNHQHSCSSTSAASTPSLTTSSPATLSTAHSADVKHPNILTDQTPAIRSSVPITDTRSRSSSPSRDSIPRTQSAASPTPPDMHPQRLNTPSNTTLHPSPTISPSATASLAVPPEPHSSSVNPSPALLAPTLRRDNLIALLQQQQDILLLSGSRDSRTVGAVALLQEQIDMLRRHQQQEEAILGLSASEAPPAYEDSVRS